ncbi:MULTISPECIES: hypothetical protein [unclassified Ruegeria]|uniref:hypothetical protein n=1 Tax=unclassified Ruegeria TaxID=2625375 RepID=UPI00148A01C1|nr:MULTISPECIES: hypothetical protein [unclassified Ruegeria]
MINILRLWRYASKLGELLFVALCFMMLTSFGAAATELKIWVKAFIPKEHPTNPGYVRPRPGHQGEFMIPDPTDASVCFATDHRLFSSDPAASARLTSSITVNFSDGNLTEAPSHVTGPTHVYWCADGTAKNPAKSAGKDQMFWGTPAQADGAIQVTLEGQANNPHVFASPNIYYAGSFLFDTSNKKLDFQMTIGSFPAFEAYAQLDGGDVVQLFTRNPADGANVWSLISFGGLNTRNVAGSVSF